MSRRLGAVVTVIRLFLRFGESDCMISICFIPHFKLDIRPVEARKVRLPIDPFAWAVVT